MPLTNLYIASTDALTLPTGVTLQPVSKGPVIINWLGGSHNFREGHGFKIRCAGRVMVSIFKVLGGSHFYLMKNREGHMSILPKVIREGHLCVFCKKTTK